MTPSNGARIRQTMLEELAKAEPSLQSNTILSRVGQRLRVGNNLELQQAILDYWHELLNSGQIAWGYDLTNCAPPFCHLTERGRETLKHLSRDPANREGYMEYLKQSAALSPIAGSYVAEALHTYGASCWKATAVMIGAAAEAVVLDLRDSLVVRISALGRTPSKKLRDWKVKTIFDSIAQELETRKAGMPRELAEAFGSYWPAFAQQIRSGRNDAGHPSSIDPVTQQSVHSALLIFPELARLAAQLRDWIKNSYT